MQIIQIFWLFVSLSFIHTKLYPLFLKKGGGGGEATIVDVCSDKEWGYDCL